MSPSASLPDVMDPTHNQASGQGQSTMYVSPVSLSPILPQTSPRTDHSVHRARTGRPPHRRARTK
jgi:hypothetical protein